MPDFCKTKEAATKIGGKLGPVLDVDLFDTRAKETQIMKVRVNLDVSNTLRQLICIANPDKTNYTILLKYEKLGVYCRCCNFLGHEVRNCDLYIQLLMADSEVPLKWRDNLRADQLGWRVTAAKENSNPNNRFNHSSFNQANKKAYSSISTSSTIFFCDRINYKSYCYKKQKTELKHMARRGSTGVEIQNITGLKRVPEISDSKAIANEGDKGANPMKAPTGQ
ncbi:hypothetical protein PIB30_005424 [Stylosanthes scabra]|uniref:Zinc knuckle CX2CX4HX4C domain-containing protein n=1 Tax=Stylosanthes scabra TaxID=79078 RepID=A0ABU6X5K3_9FABA|nr:hypothetical protein [Stylosanthes scabra]